MTSPRRGPHEVFSRCSELVGLAEKMPPEIGYVLLYTAAEMVAALVIECSSERKLRRALCRLRSWRRIGRALAILRREGVIDEEGYRRLRRCFSALRCLRNSFIHPVCVERCRGLGMGEAIECLRFFESAARTFVERSLSCR